MARFGKLPVEIPEGVKLEIEKNRVKVVGPKGELERDIPRGIEVVKEDNIAHAVAKNDKKANLAHQGTTRAHLVNMIKGVTEGWQKQLEINGPGYRAEVRGDDLVLTAGYSHPVTIKGDNVTFKVEKSLITVEGIDKDIVGQTAALVRDVRKPNPYKGTGIKYADEIIRKKAGKQATGSAAG